MSESESEMVLLRVSESSAMLRSSSLSLVFGGVEAMGQLLLTPPKKQMRYNALRG